MSEDAGLEEVAEFFRAAASCFWSLATTASSAILTLVAPGTQDGAMVATVTWQDADHFTFRIVGAQATNPGLSFRASNSW